MGSYHYPRSKTLPRPTPSVETEKKTMPSLVMERHPFVTLETHTKVMERLTTLKREWHCNPCNYTIPGAEQARVYAWSHHIAVVCQCGYMTARRGTMMAHVQRAHKHSHTITQVDAACWEKLRDTHPIPQSMPTLPIMHLRKERPTTPVREVYLDEDEP